VCQNFKLKMSSWLSGNRCPKSPESIKKREAAMKNIDDKENDIKEAIERICSRKCKKTVTKQTPCKSIKTSPSINSKLSNPKHKRILNNSKNQNAPFRELFKTAAFPSETKSSSMNSRSTKPQTSPQLLCPKVSLYNRPTIIHDQEYTNLLKSKNHKTPFTKDQTISIPSKLPVAQPPTKLNVPTISQSPSPLNQSGKSLKKSKIPLLINPTTNRPKFTRQRILANQSNLTTLRKSLDFSPNDAISSTPNPRKSKSTVISKNTKLCQPSQQLNLMKKPPVSKMKQPAKITQQPTNLNRNGALPTKQVPERKQPTKAPSYSLTKVKCAKTISNKRIPEVRQASNTNVKNASPRGARGTKVLNQNVKNVKKAPQKSAPTRQAEIIVKKNPLGSNIYSDDEEFEHEGIRYKRFVFKIPSLVTHSIQASYKRIPIHIPLHDITVTIPKISPSKNVSLHDSPKRKGRLSDIFSELHEREAEAYLEKREKTKFKNLQKVKDSAQRDTENKRKDILERSFFLNISKEYNRAMKSKNENKNK
jgi:hypothetical protein